MRSNLLHIKDTIELVEEMIHNIKTAITLSLINLFAIDSALIMAMFILPSPFVWMISIPLLVLTTIAFTGSIYNERGSLWFYKNLFESLKAEQTDYVNHKQIEDTKPKQTSKDQVYKFYWKDLNDNNQ